MEFEAFPKIPRYDRTVIVTEKIDGTNASIWWSGDMSEMKVGSRSRWITPEADNFGFATWAEKNREELKKLGPGHHFGEWWGVGIQRNYGISERRFSLFNTHRWLKGYDAMLLGHENDFPKCCRVVPVLAMTTAAYLEPKTLCNQLLAGGSKAEPGYMKPEGIVIWHTSARQLFKMTCENDEKGKSE